MPQLRKAHAKATKTQHKSNEDLAESKVKIKKKKNYKNFKMYKTSSRLSNLNDENTQRHS